MAFESLLRQHGVPVDSYLRRHRLPVLCSDPDAPLPLPSILVFMGHFHESTRLTPGKIDPDNWLK